MSFPEIKFGVCPECGSKGKDYPASALTSADAQDNLDTTGHGVVLEYYNGKLMCELCKKQKQADEESLNSASKHAEEEKFRQKAGFTQSI